MTINRNQISRLMYTGLKTVFGQMPIYPEQWAEIYKTYPSDKAQETDLEMRYMGPADIVPEGQPATIDTMSQRWVTNYVHKKVVAAFTITKEALQDNQYQSQFPQKAVSMRNSLRITKDTLGANVLNQAFNPQYSLGDGQALCSLTHPIDGGTFANKPAVGVAIAEASLEAAMSAVQSFPMASGVLARIMARKIVIPRDKQFETSKLLNSRYVPNSANNAINPLAYHNYIPEGFVVNQYLTDQTCWFVLTDAEEGFKHFQRTAVEVDTYADPNTTNILCRGEERYSFGVSNSRCVYGSAVGA